MYSLFTEMLLGLSTIRAYAKESEFLSRHFKISDYNGKIYFMFWMARLTAILKKKNFPINFSFMYLSFFVSRWLAVRIDSLSNLIILFVGVIAVLMKDFNAPVDANILGLALIYALQLTGLLQWTVRVVIETENNMTSVERLAAFDNILSEADRVCDKDKTIDTSWPSKGEISICNLSMRYRDGLDLVLRGIDLNIPAGSKVGICGRTGSGKSSLMLALFRIIEPESGVVEIDGINILNIGLEMLRSNLTSKLLLLLLLLLIKNHII